MASQPIIDTPVTDPRAMIRAILFNRRHDYDYSSSDSAVAFISGLLRHYDGLLPQDEQRLSTIAGIYDMETIKRLTHEIGKQCCSPHSNTADVEKQVRATQYRRAVP